MKIIRSIAAMQSVSRKLALKRKPVGFVPTMGALHEGHLSLIRKARKENNIVVVSIFVNPAQFSKGEDFSKYPRDLKRDVILCRKEKVDIVFAPAAAEMYPKGYKTHISVNDLSDLLCGKFRPGHFKGVATIVAKFFNIINPAAAYFGQKDLQQSVIIRRMAEDLNMPVKIKVLPVIREKDGLAKSSRNRYLGESERKAACALYAALRAGDNLIRFGIKDSEKIIRGMRLILKKNNARIDYIDIVDLDSLRRVKKAQKECAIIMAAWIGKTRLIDNIIIN